MDQEGPSDILMKGYFGRDTRDLRAVDTSFTYLFTLGSIDIFFCVRHQAQGKVVTLSVGLHTPSV